MGKGVICHLLRIISTMCHVNKLEKPDHENSSVLMCIPLSLTRNKWHSASLKLYCHI